MSKDEKKPTDWEAIEREYRAGQLSEAEIARQHDISRAAIQKRAKKQGWSRDLTEKVRQEVAARLVAEGLQGARGAATVELAAERGVQLIREHRQDIGTNRKAVTKLIDELHETLDHIEEIETDIIDETAGDKGTKRRDRMLAAVALPSRAQVASTLATALKTLIPLERQAFNLQEGSGENPVDATDKTVTHKIDPASAELLKRLVE
jgi:phage-related tail protein